MVKHKALSITKTAACKLLGIQLVIAVVLALLLLLNTGVDYARSALLGALVFILPNAYFTYSAFRGNDRESPGFIVRRFYTGEAGKLVLTAVMFLLCFVLVQSLQVMVFFTMYAAMMIINLAGLTWFRVLE